MRTSILLSILLISITSACESIFNNENNEEALSAIIQNDTFIIKNNLPFDIYFFAVDQETSYVIDWIPVESDANRVKAVVFENFLPILLLVTPKGKQP